MLFSCSYSKLNRHCRVFNSNELDFYLCVKLPCEMVGYRLYDILDVSGPSVKTVSMDGVVFDGLHPWIDIPWNNLSRISGKHVYKLAFMRQSACADYLTTYISYIIQDDAPNKPYLYMNRYNSSQKDKQALYVEAGQHEDSV